MGANIADEMLSRAAEEAIWLRGAELLSFCDLLQSCGQIGDWTKIRAADYLLGRAIDRCTWLDETPRLWLGQVFGRNWYMPA